MAKKKKCTCGGTPVAKWDEIKNGHIAYCPCCGKRIPGAYWTKQDALDVFENSKYDL